MITKNLFDMAAMTDPKMPEPVYTVSIHGRWHDAAPHPPAFDLPDGAHTLITTTAALAYAEALAKARVAQERERLKARLLGMDDAVKGRHNYYAHAAWVLFDGDTQPPETGKEK